MSKKLTKGMEEKLEIMKGENPKFYEYLHSKNDEDHTFMKYQVVVRGFVPWLKEKDKTIETIGESDVIDYAKYLEEHEKSVRTCNNKIVIINVYL